MAKIRTKDFQFSADSKIPFEQLPTRVEPAVIPGLRGSRTYLWRSSNETFDRTLRRETK